LAQWDGQLIRDSLREHDIVITPPFDLRGAGGMKADFCRSRSAEDWEEFERVTAEHGFRNWEQPDVISHWFITTDRIFNHFMDNWWGVFSELEECVHSRDAHDPAYSPRAFDFLTERFFTMWLRQQELKTIILPLMVCWDAK
jgi:hypothetical protein